MVVVVLVWWRWRRWSADSGPPRHQKTSQAFFITLSLFLPSSDRAAVLDEWMEDPFSSIGGGGEAPLYCRFNHYTSIREKTGSDLIHEESAYSSEIEM